MKTAIIIGITVFLILIAYVGLKESGRPPTPERERLLGGDNLTNEQWRNRGYREEPYIDEDTIIREERSRLKEWIRRANLSWKDIDNGELIKNNDYDRETGK